MKLNSINALFFCSEENSNELKAETETHKVRQLL